MGGDNEDNVVVLRLAPPWQLEASEYLDYTIRSCIALDMFNIRTFCGFYTGETQTNVGKASLKPNNVDSQAIWLRGQDIAARNGLLYSAETLQTMDTLHETKSMDNIIDHLSMGRQFEENITSNLNLFGNSWKISMSAK